MRYPILNREAAVSQRSKPGGRATVVLLAVIVAFGVSAVSGAIVLQWQRSAAERQANVDWAAEQEAKAALQKSGFLLISDPRTGHVDHVDFLERKDLDVATFQNLAALRHVGSLNLYDTNISDEQLRYIAGLKHLRCLLLGDTRITDNGLRYLTHLPNLASLYLGGTNVSSEGLRHVAGLGSLQVLDLRNTPVTEEGLAHLRRVDQLEVLVLNEVTESGIPYLLRMQNLKCLTVNRKKISQDKLRELKETRPQLTIHEAR